MGSDNREKGRSIASGQGRTIAVTSITLLATITLVVYAVTKDPTILEFCRWVIVLVVMITVSSAKEIIKFLKDILKRFLLP
jgi:hypothetical protein